MKKSMKTNESERVEFKKSTAELKQALKTLCAFANNGEGTVYFGIDDKGKITGQEVSDNTIKRISASVLSLIEPRLYPNIYVKKINNKDVLLVEIKNSPEKPYFYKGKAYKRIGTSDAYLSRYELEKFLYERANPAYRFDRMIAEDYRDGVSAKTLKWFLKNAKETRNLPIDLSEDKNTILNKLGLMTQDKLNFAGLLAFGKKIQKHFPDIILKCAVFEGADKTGRILDHIEINANAFRQIDYAENFILRNIRKAAWINPQTGRREERYELPYLAIREAVANAVAHRDYRIPSHIDIAIFDNRIEIWSPGALPFGIEIKELSKGHLSVLRNPAVAELLFLAGYIERWGTGIDKMNKMMRDYGLFSPEYKEIAGNFVVIFQRKSRRKKTQVSSGKRRSSTVQVASKYRPSTVQVKIIVFCKKPKHRDEIQQYTGFKHRGHFRANILKPIIENGLIKMTIQERPNSPKQKYVITKKGTRVLEELKRGEL
ncbi:MAG: putative DNA binding domain-containing protein [Elusimicrobiota bacterium]|nr:putative DNA binding domain-containing protein [Elusimicrobiota bacterium]